MIRNILIAVVFFFGPALLMMMARGAFFLLRLWLQARLRQGRQPDVIDVTPKQEEAGLPIWFYVLAILLGVMSAGLAWHYLSEDTSPAVHRIYIPAHMDANGNIVPGHWEPAPESSSGS